MRGRVIAGMAWVTLCSAAPLAAQAQEAFAFIDVSVIPMDRDRVLTHQTVVVQGDRIVALGPVAEVGVPATAQRIDGRGRFLMPGLADMHTHIRDAPGLFVYLANGVTTIRDMGQALERLHVLAMEVELMPPHIYGRTALHECTAGVAVTACFAARKALGADIVKTGGRETPAQFDTIVTTARAVGLPVGGHVTPGPGLERALQVPYRSIEHLFGYLDVVLGTPLPVFYGAGGPFGEPVPDTAAWLQPAYHLDATKLHRVAALTQQAGTWNAPTLVAMEVLAAMAASHAPEKQRAVQRRFELRFPLIKALHEAGAGLLLSADLNRLIGGYAVHRELTLLVQAGLTPYEALATGTRAVARYLGTQDSTGTVAVGQLADLVLLEGNPLEDIHHATHPAGVMAQGRWLPREALEAQLDRLEAQGCRLAPLRQEAGQHRGIQLGSLMTAMEHRC